LVGQYFCRFWTGQQSLKILNKFTFFTSICRKLKLASGNRKIRKFTQFLLKICLNVCRMHCCISYKAMTVRNSPRHISTHLFWAAHSCLNCICLVSFLSSSADRPNTKRSGMGGNSARLPGSPRSTRSRIKDWYVTSWVAVSAHKQSWLNKVVPAKA